MDHLALSRVLGAIVENLSLVAHPSLSAAVNRWCWSKEDQLEEHFDGPLGRDLLERVIPLFVQAMEARILAAGNEVVRCQDFDLTVEFFVLGTPFCENQLLRRAP